MNRLGSRRLLVYGAENYKLMLGEILRAFKTTRTTIARRHHVARCYVSCGSLGLLLIAAVVAAPKARAGDPKELFVKTCAPCHSKDGTAQTPAAKKLGVKDLSQSKLTDQQIVQAIREGKQDKEGTTKMPAFKDKLTPDEVESLVPLVKGFRK